ncbi:MAG TPA: ATP-binding SpoIIE family protein phosphatase [Phycisphaerales bacterium]|nr:ATP-binding SpoIIE family protein phosphatase [Phycisphaerales bacterium]
MPRSYGQPVQDQSQVAEARRNATLIAQRHGLTEEAVSDVAIVVTELATNLVKHAGGGQLLFRPLSGASSTDLGLEVLSIDKGPGIANIPRSLSDGYSTAGTPGNGLGAVQRQSQVFDIYSKPGEGTIILSEVWNAPARLATSPITAPRVGVVNLPIKGEEHVGDAWAVHHSRGLTAVLVIDGLGHGLAASEAARAGIDAFEQSPLRAAGEQMQVLHGALRSTRGGAGAVCVVDHARRTVSYCGIGNIAGVLASDGGERHMVSQSGILGLEAKVRTEFNYPWSDDGVLIMASDGVTTRWSVSSQPQLLRKHPALIAAAIYRDHSRGRDDTTVVVVRSGA